MNEQVLVTSSIVFLGTFIVYCFVVILGITIYDLGAVSRDNQRKRNAYRLAKPKQPQLTVLVLAHNNELTIEACLTSLLKSRYKNFKIVVIDNASTDSTRAILRKYTENKNTASLEVLYKRKPASRIAMLYQGLKKAVYSSHIFVLDADSTVAPNILKQAVASMYFDSLVRVVTLNSHVARSTSLFGFLHRLAQLSSNQYRKFTSLLPFCTIPVDSSGTLFAADFLKDVQKPANANERIVLSRKSVVRSSLSVRSNCVAPPTRAFFMPSVRSTRLTSMRSFKKHHNNYLRLLQRVTLGLFSFVGGLVLILLPLLMTYVLFAAFTSRTISLLLFSWLVLMFWLLFVVWSDKESKTSEKLELTYGLPMSYLLMYVQLLLNIVPRIVLTIRTLFNASSKPAH